jgi:hypothetical protein
MGYTYNITDSFTRPNNTTAYADGDIIANHATAGSVVPLKFAIGARGGHIVRVAIQKTDQTDVVNSDFTLQLFTEDPTFVNGDNGAFAAGTNISGHFASITIPLMTAYSDDAQGLINVGETGGPQVSAGYSSIHAVGPVIYGVLMANGAYSPVAEEVFTVILTIDPDTA